VPGYRDLLANRRFLYYFASSATGEAGYAVYAISILWLALQISGSLLITGLVLFVEFGIYAFSFLAGPFVDRAANLRTVLLIGYPVQGILALAIGVFEYAHLLTIPLLLGLVIAISFAWNFTWTAVNALPPRIVPEDQLFLANGLLSAVTGGNQIAGYAAGAALILLTGVSGGAVLYGLLNFAGAFLAIPVSVPRRPSPPKSIAEDFTAGWRFITGGPRRPLLQLSIFSAAQALFSAAPPLLIALLATSRFPNPALSYSVLFTVFAIGGIAGSIGLGQWNPRRRLPEIWIGVSIAEGLLILAAVLVAPALGWSVIVWFWVGVVDVAFYTALIVFFQATTPAGMLGRALNNTYVFRGSSRAVGALVVGVLATSLGAVQLGGLVGGVLILVGITGPFVFPAVRKLTF
jgi:hypothetical protein